MEDDPSAYGRANRLPFSGRLPRGFPRKTIIAENQTQCNKSLRCSTRPAGLFLFTKQMKGRDRIDTTYTIQLTESQYAPLLDRAAELEIPLEDLLLQAMQNYLEESDHLA